MGFTWEYICVSHGNIHVFDTDYLYDYVPDNWYAEPIFIYGYKIDK